MTKYTVEIEGLIVCYTSFVIEADNLEDANDLAQAKVDEINEGDPDQIDLPDPSTYDVNRTSSRSWEINGVAQSDETPPT